MRVNTARSIKTGTAVHARFGSWKAAKDAASYEGGKFVVRSATNGHYVTKAEAPKKA